MWLHADTSQPAGGSVFPCTLSQVLGWHCQRTRVLSPAAPVRAWVQEYVGWHSFQSSSLQSPSATMGCLTGCCQGTACGLLNQASKKLLGIKISPLSLKVAL